MIIWCPPLSKASNDNIDVDEDDSIWTELVRLGEVGGNVLGFLGGQFVSGEKDEAESILGYSFNGAFHSWIEKDVGKWTPGVVFGGHFAPVEDLDWDKSGR